MKLQKLYALTTFIILITTLSAYGMEENTHDMHPLLCLPQEIQQQIVFPWYTNDTKIDPLKMNALKEVAQTFFKFNILSRDFYRLFKLPWSEFEREKKNKMLKKIINYMTVLAYEDYRIVPLVLVYSGADADVKPKLWSTCPCKAVCEDDETAVAMLLKYGANPYQLDEDKQICFYAKTMPIAKLFLEKVDDKEKLLSNLNKIDGLLAPEYPSEIMAFWVAQGMNLHELYFAGHSCFFHMLVRSIYWYGNTMENIFAKGELLVKYIPEMINTLDWRGDTPVDMAIREDNKNNCCIREAPKKVLAFLRKYGGKTSQELDAEKFKTEQTIS